MPPFRAPYRPRQPRERANRAGKGTLPTRLATPDRLPCAPLPRARRDPRANRDAGAIRRPQPVVRGQRPGTRAPSAIAPVCPRRYVFEQSTTTRTARLLRTDRDPGRRDAQDRRSAILVLHDRPTLHPAAGV